MGFWRWLFVQADPNSPPLPQPKPDKKMEGDGQKKGESTVAKFPPKIELSLPYISEKYTREYVRRLKEVGIQSVKTAQLELKFFVRDIGEKVIQVSPYHYLTDSYFTGKKPGGGDWGNYSQFEARTEIIREGDNRHADGTPLTGTMAYSLYAGFLPVRIVDIVDGLQKEFEGRMMRIWVAHNNHPEALRFLNVYLDGATQVVAVWTAEEEKG